MNKRPYIAAIILITIGILNVSRCLCQVIPLSVPLISGLTYDSITPTSVTVIWTTDLPADSKIRWMAADSNYQALVFTDSAYQTGMITNHAIQINNLLPARIYKYQVFSENPDGIVADSGYFITQSLSTGKMEVYFNHSVDNSVSTGENANGNTNFEALFIRQIDSAKHSIDITLWGFEYYNTISNALVKAKNRGVKIRFVNNHKDDTPLIDTLLAHQIPVLTRNFDTTFSMHNKFWIFDHRYNSNPDNQYLWTGSTNVSHAQFHSDKNNIIIIQDEALCEVYTREFEEMWGSHTDLFNASRARFGAQKKDNVPHILNVAGTRMEVYFSPSDSVSRFLSSLMLAQTTHSLFFCMLKFNLPNVEASLLSLHNNMKQIKGVFDLSDSQLPNSAYPRMKGWQVPNAWNPPADVYTDSLSGLIHHKYFIIDANTAHGNKIISTGSFNWELPADLGNDENSLTIFDARINNLYFQEFSSRFLESGGETIDINGIQSEVPDHIRIWQNFPNPFNNSTTIRYELLVPGTVNLSIYDFQGRKMETLVNCRKDKGTHEAVWNASACNSGAYWYLLTVDGVNITKKIILIK
ncbi:MAG: phospholipase D-like domain-containing protein [Bacteroidales bacterium]